MPYNATPGALNVRSAYLGSSFRKSFFRKPSAQGFHEPLSPAMPARRLRRVLFRSLAALVTLAVVLAALKITKWPLGFMAEKGWLPDEPPCVV